MHTKIEEHYVKNHKKLIHKFSYFSKNGTDGEDIVQDAYERALKYYDEDCPPLNFDHWFNRILYTSMLDHKRKEFGNSVEYEENDYEGIPCQQFNQEVVSQIYNLIAAKPEDDIRERLYLYFKYGYGITDIHNIVGGPHITTRKLIERFKVELREKFGE